MRAEACLGMANSLICRASLHSNQDEVWSAMAELRAKASAPSPTSAMSHVFKTREDELRKCEQLFKALPNQVGLLAIIDGHLVGLDLLSLTTAYAKLHLKLVRSYVLEGLLGTPNPGGGPREATTASPGTAAAQARKFLAEIATAEEHQFPCIGYGIDHRYQGKALAGTALVHENEVIHAAFFRLNEMV